MALHLQVLSILSYSKAGLIDCKSLPPGPPLSHQSILSNIKCHASTHSCEPTTNRRSANYQLSIRGMDDMTKIFGNYFFDNIIVQGEDYIIRANKLKKEVKHRIDDGSMGQLDLSLSLSLSLTLVNFKFTDFKASYFKDEKGILSLYEASHLAVEGESILEEAKDFTRRTLKEINGNMESNLAKQVNHALKFPLHWRMPRLEASWYIDVYEKKENSFPALTELTKLDYNMVQAVHQENAADLPRWWKNLGLGDQLSFARDTLIQCFLWTLDSKPEPQFRNFRVELTKVNMLITMIDDVYDVYGTLEELELFTNAVERWDIKAIEQLPDYMKMCFLAFFNTVNEMTYFHLKEHEFDSLPFPKENGIDLCKSYLIEAKWYYKGHKTTLEEYLNNAVTSIGGNVILILIHYFFLIAELKRGDVLKSIQSYMHQTGASEEVAREHISHLIDEAWKQINKNKFTKDSLLPQPFIKTCVNLARISLCIYQHGDGHIVIDDVSNNHVKSLLFEPIPVSNNHTKLLL
ncbi:hypothetical protein NE237_008828 [Protea cynaroides]|uniref:Uncharacterized protein n=1 Tax=Protea cynaroides TaxID=273540 RepID=A0A9Q0KWE6_9MAGN|nr:hypothetical protein NE237_008828 [Protea cynaroides]